MPKTAPAWTRTCNGPHAETAEPCSCPDADGTCCLDCPFARCILEDVGDDKRYHMGSNKYRQLGRMILQLRSEGRQDHYIRTQLGIDNVAFRRSVQAAS